MNSNYVIIGQNPQTKDFWFHERENNNGQPGKIVCMGDGRGDVKGTVDRYVEKGFDPSKIIINGQPATDVFQKSSDKDVKKLDNRDLALRSMLYAQVNPLLFLLDKDYTNTMRANIEEARQQREAKKAS